MHQRFNESVRCASDCLIAVVVLAVMFLVSPGQVSAELATSQEMTQVGQNWATLTGRTHDGWAGESDPRITGVHEIYDDDLLLARVYDIAPQGYVLVPALKEMPPVMMYSDESNWSDADDFGPGQMIREVIKSRMEAFASVYGSVTAAQPSGDGLFDASQKESWSKFAVTEREFRTDVSLSAEASNGPLLTSSWSQGYPYNNYCPEGDGGRCVVGCVATSATQIMDYWEWPESGVGSYGYLWAGDGPVGAAWLTADFSDEYDWANIPDSCDLGCDAAQQDALAELCYEAGVALNMDYGASASGTSMDYSVFARYFKYSPDIIREDRVNHTQQSWFDLIRNEIDAGRVAWYGINSHAIVCDGYRDEYGQLEYHLNYGWGGSHTAWYVLDNLYCYWIDGDVCPWDEDLIIYNIRPQLDPIITSVGLSATEYNGDGDGLVEAGEQALLYPVLRNNGNDAVSVQGTLSSADANITVTTGLASYPSPLLWGGSGGPQTAYVVDVSASAPDQYAAALTLDITADGGYGTSVTVYLCVGNVPGLQTDFDGSSQGWSHQAQTTAFGDQWHEETYRYHSGTTSWKFGGVGAADYQSVADGGLISPPFIMPHNAKMSFYDWIDAEDDANFTAWDGAIVMVSTEAGVWSQVSPQSGYPYSIIDNPASPFAPFTPCFSGSHGWQQETIDLSGISGVAQVMFRFGSDGYVTAEGWYVDDIQVYNTEPGTAVSVQPCDSLTVTFASVTGYGVTSALATEPTQALPEAYVAVPSGCFDLTAYDFAYTGTIGLVLRYDPALLNRSEDQLILLHFNGSDWVDVTTGVDINANEISAEVSSLSQFALVESASCCHDRVGDANNSGDDEPTIGDVSAIIDALFISGTFEGTIFCLAEADINQSGGFNPVSDDITIGDISILIDYLFITGPYGTTNPGGVVLSDCL